MDSSEIDLNAYALGEGTPAERKAAAAYLAAHAEAHDELERLEYTLAALGTLRDEELPRRIAFVSDPVFEPSLWQRFWSSGPRLAFAGAAMLAMAITAHGVMTRPQVIPVAQSPANLAAPISQAQLDAAVNKAVMQAVKAVQARNDERMRAEVANAVARTEKHFTQEIQLMSATMQENEKILRKQLNKLYVTNAGLSVDGTRE
jgi:hypothetical protein